METKEWSTVCVGECTEHDDSHTIQGSTRIKSVFGTLKDDLAKLLKAEFPCVKSVSFEDTEMTRNEDRREFKIGGKTHVFIGDKQLEEEK